MSVVIFLPLFLTKVSNTNLWATTKPKKKNKEKKEKKNPEPKKKNPNF